jgi:hypothetical protein
MRNNKEDKPNQVNDEMDPNKIEQRPERAQTGEISMNKNRPYEDRKDKYQAHVSKQQ